MVAAVIADLVGGDRGQIATVLKEVDNCSAFQQELEKKFIGTGHFQRGTKEARPLDDLLADLEKQANG